MVLTLGQALIIMILLKRVLLPRFETTKKEKAFGAGTFQFGGLLGGAGLPQGFLKRKVCAAVLGSAAVRVHRAYVIVSATGHSLHPPVAAAQL